MTQHDFSKKTDAQLETWLANHEKQGQTNSDLYRALCEEVARRRGKGLNLDRSLEFLMQAAREKRFVTYGEVAAASGVEWKHARHAMNGERGHLDQLLSICHARGLPLFPSICVNQSGALTGTLGPEALEGFIKGLRRLGRAVTDGEATLRASQTECFDWAATTHPK